MDTIKKAIKRITPKRFSKNQLSTSKSSSIRCKAKKLISPFKRRSNSCSRASRSKKCSKLKLPQEKDGFEADEDTDVGSENESESLIVAFDCGHQSSATHKKGSRSPFRRERSTPVFGEEIDSRQTEQSMRTPSPLRQNSFKQTNSDDMSISINIVNNTEQPLKSCLKPQIWSQRIPNFDLSFLRLPNFEDQELIFTKNFQNQTMNMKDIIIQNHKDRMAPFVANVESLSLTYQDEKDFSDFENVKLDSSIEISNDQLISFYAIFSDPYIERLLNVDCCCLVTGFGGHSKIFLGNIYFFYLCRTVI